MKMRTISISNDFFALAADQLNEGKTVRIKVQGNSMFPFLHNGDEIEICPISKDENIPLWTGVFYKWQGQYMVHRLVQKEGQLCHMLGDGNAVRIETVGRDEILGVLTCRFKANGTITDCRSKAWLNYGKNWFKIRRIRGYIIRIMLMLHMG